MTRETENFFGFPGLIFPKFLLYYKSGLLEKIVTGRKMPEEELVPLMYESGLNWNVENQPIEKVWDQLLRELEKQVSVQSIKTWLKPCTLVNMNESMLFIRVPNQFFYEWIETRYGQALRDSAQRLFRRDMKVEYVIPPLKGLSELPMASVEEIGTISGAGAPEEVRESNSDLRIGYTLHPGFTFDRFISIRHNQFARKAAELVVEMDGKTLYNPLFVYGPTGTGKTHLIQAIGHELQKRGKRVLYLTAEKFAQEYVRALKRKALDEFSQTLRSVDALLFDDIQFLAGKTRLQSELFHTINELILCHKQVVLTGNRSPVHFKDFEQEFVSRIQSGLVVDLQIPDLESRKTIIRNYFQREGLKISDHLVDMIARNIRSHIRELEGILIRLSARVSLLGEELTESMVKNCLLELASSMNSEQSLFSPDKPSLRRVVETVAEFYGKPVEELCGKTRKRDVAKIRKMAVYCCRMFTDESVSAIGKFFGRTHAFVIYSIQEIEQLLSSEPDLELQVSRIKHLVSEK